MRNIISLFVLGLMFTGCIPKSSTELVNSAGTTESYCYDIESAVVEERLQQYLTTCYSSQTTTTAVLDMPLAVQLNEQIIKEQISNGVRYSQRNSSGFGYSADVLPNTDNCKTKVQMFGVSYFWKTFVFGKVDSAIKGENPSCPM